uniref:Uncharacterized protein n=1 Tax=Arundo donax TaxID=35708 RepID=A0A0A9HSN6_ARUDO
MLTFIGKSHMLCSTHGLSCVARKFMAFQAFCSIKCVIFDIIAV